jgi:uncharacterized protein
MKLGIISDTHNYLDPRIPGLFQGVRHILHAGDIGQPQLLVELEQIAPVTAVNGNTDDPAFRYALTRVVELAGRKFLLHHIVDPCALEASLAERIGREQPQVVVFGHTHKPFAETIGGILYFNPGYAGKSRFGMPRTVGLLHCDQRSIRTEFVPL